MGFEILKFLRNVLAEKVEEELIYWKVYSNIKDLFAPSCLSSYSRLAKDISRNLTVPLTILRKEHFNFAWKRFFYW